MANPIATFLATAAGAGGSRISQGLQRLLGYANSAERPITLPRDLLGGVNEAGGNERNYYIALKFKKYERRGIREQPFYSTVGTYKLPIPKELVDTTSVNYEDVSLGSVVGLATEAIAYNSGANRAVATGGAVTAAAITTSINALGASLTRNPVTTNTPLGTGLAQTASQNAAAAVNAAKALTGITPNPFQTTLFKNPNFKTHRFSWNFIPKDEDESIDLRDMIRAFRFHMLPGTIAGGALFSFPEILEIKLYPDDRFMYKFKPCVLKNMSVNYAANGPSFYRRTDAPTAVTISVDLQEIEFWTKNDFGPASTRETGGA